MNPIHITALGVILALSPIAANALPLARSSSLQLQAQANAGSGLIIDIDGTNQLSTVNPLIASVSASATSGNASVLTQAQGKATWVDTSQGKVDFLNVGWNTVGVTNGDASLSHGLGWIYEFTADKSGLFTLDYDIISSGTYDWNDTLGGFHFFWSGTGGYEFLESNTSGGLTRAITAGETYKVQILTAPVATGALQNSNLLTNGIFQWKMDTNPATTPVSVPEPSTLAMLGTSIIGLWSIGRKKSN